MNPIYLYVAAGIAVVSATAGWKVRDWQCTAATAKALAKAEERRVEAERGIAVVSAKYEDLRESTYDAGQNRSQLVREIYRDVQVSADCAVGDAAYSLLANSVRDANAASPRQSGEVVPAGADAAEAAR